MQLRTQLKSTSATKNNNDKTCKYCFDAFQISSLEKFGKKQSTPLIKYKEFLDEYHGWYGRKQI